VLRYVGLEVEHVQVEQKMADYSSMILGFGSLAIVLSFLAIFVLLIGVTFVGFFDNYKQAILAISPS
jgi:hypothetical protein